MREALAQSAQLPLDAPGPVHQARVAGARCPALAHLVAAAGVGALDLVQAALGAVQVRAQASHLCRDLLLLGRADAPRPGVGDRNRAAGAAAAGLRRAPPGEVARELGARLL